MIGDLSIGQLTSAEMTKLRNAHSQERNVKLEPLVRQSYNNGGRQVRVQKALAQQRNLLKKKSSKAKLATIMQSNGGMQIIEEPHSFN